MIRLVWILASLRAGGVRVRWRQLPAARRSLAAAGDAPGATYEALEAVFNPHPRDREVFDAVVLGGLPVARVLPAPPVRCRAHDERG